MFLSASLESSNKISLVNIFFSFTKVYNKRIRALSYTYIYKLFIKANKYYFINIILLYKYCLKSISSISLKVYTILLLV